MSFKWVLASNNMGKLRELQAMLMTTPTLHGVECVTQGALSIPACDEPFGTFIENALHKARHASRLSGLPAIADDSGLCVPALGGAPGVFSARYAEDEHKSNADDEALQLSSDARNNRKLIRTLQQLIKQPAQQSPLGQSIDRRAYYYCVLVYVATPDDPQPMIADGMWWGEVVDEPQGTGGFGYDPHIYLPQLGMTAAQLAPELKNKHSHRGQALRRLTEQLATRYVTRDVPI
jgi:XTP/dITP diphosphohydrolase